MGRELAEEGFRPDETRALEAALSRGEVPTCPRCAGALAISRVGTPPEVAYVRRRTLLVCPACRISAAVDA
ncbi:MAG TPA: hypothetical protein VML95_11285 [Longimicrobiales bacterium]|nr:hypothetical protein [Longimicrobiales bacterium]